MTPERRDGRDTRDWAAAGDGILVVDKPAGWTSHDVVAKVRFLARTRKVGHAGTLDPMATGVLVVGVGRATRLLTHVVGVDKEYLATVRLGESTTTDDAEGERCATVDAGEVQRVDVEREAARLTGEILQRPSAVSAIKVDGVRSYARVRAGQKVVLAQRPVTVGAFDVVDVRVLSGPDGRSVCDIDVHVSCSSGTYVRALARDLGRALDVGGHLTRLRRTRVGGFMVDEATGIDELEAATRKRGRLALLDPACAAERVLPLRRVTVGEATDLTHGRFLTANGRTGPVAAIDPEGALIAVVLDESRRGNVVARPVTVFAVH